MNSNRIPKWCMLITAILPLMVFMITMLICIRIVQKRGNYIWDERYELNENVLYNDISAYGMDSPEHSIFATGFTILSLVLCCSMYFRYTLWKQYLTRAQQPQRSCCSCCCSFNTAVLAVGWLHAPLLIVMGWTDGKQGQQVHFPAAMLGLGMLHLYCVLNFFLSLQVIRRAILSRKQQVCLGAEMFVLGVISVCVPFCVFVWIWYGQAWYEWMAVFLLLCSTVPAFLNFWAMPEDYMCLTTSSSHDDEVQELESGRQDPLLDVGDGGLKQPVVGFS